MVDKLKLELEIKNYEIEKLKSNIKIRERNFNLHFKFFFKIGICEKKIRNEKASSQDGCQPQRENLETFRDCCRKV